MERSKAIPLHWRTLFTSATLNSTLSSFNSSLQRVISGNPGRPETWAKSNRAMELNRELMGITDSLEHLTAEWTEKLAELEQDAGSTTSVGFCIPGCRTTRAAKKRMEKLLPLPCVCQITPARRSNRP